MTDPLAEALAFVETVPIPAPVALHEFELSAESELPSPDFADPRGIAVVVGSQIAGFADTVSPTLREQISDTFLLAQLAADKALETGGGTGADWYDTYVATLGKVGWTAETKDRTLRIISGAAADVHRETIPLITVLLGPTAAAAPGSFLALMNGLAGMDKDASWLTLFQSRSQRANANQFQISHAGIENGSAVVRLAGFELDAARSVTQVLFFRFDRSDATLRQFSQTLAINERVFSFVAPKLAAKLSGHASKAIAAIDI